MRLTIGRKMDSQSSVAIPSSILGSGWRYSCPKVKRKGGKVAELSICGELLAG